MNARGQAVATWQRFEGGTYRPYAGRFEPDRRWSPEEAILAEADIADTRVAIDAQGEAIVVLRGDVLLQSSVGVPGRPWTAAQTIADGSLPSLAMDESGRAHLLFAQAGVGVFVLDGTAAGWTTIQKLQSNEGLAGIASLDLSVAHGGNAIAAWTRGETGDERRHVLPSSSVWTSRLRAGQPWSAAEQSGVLEEALSFDLAALANDEGTSALAYGVWGPRDIFQWAVWGQHTAVGATSWQAPEHLSAPAGGPTILKRFPRFAAAGRGDVLLTWVDQEELRGPGARTDIRARWFSPARAAWSDVSSVAAEPEGETSRFDVTSALSAAGNAVVAWTERFDNQRQRLRASHYVPGSGWSAAEDIRIGTMSPPEVAMDASGRATIVWAEWGDDRLRIWSARLTPTTR